MNSKRIILGCFSVIFLGLLIKMTSKTVQAASYPGLPTLTTSNSPLPISMSTSPLPVSQFGGIPIYSTSPLAISLSTSVLQISGFISSTATLPVSSTSTVITTGTLTAWQGGTWLQTVTTGTITAVLSVSSAAPTIQMADGTYRPLGYGNTPSSAPVAIDIGDAGGTNRMANYGSGGSSVPVSIQIVDAAGINRSLGWGATSGSIPVVNMPMGIVTSTPTAVASLGNITGKTLIWKSGYISTSATATAKNIFSYTVSANKTLFLEYIDVFATKVVPELYFPTAFGSAYIDTPKGIVVASNTFNNSLSEPTHWTMTFGEPIPISGLIESSADVITFETITWHTTIVGYEK